MPRRRPASHAGPPFPTASVREAVRQAVAQTSVRNVAAAVGLSHGGLHKFLMEQGEPYYKTQNRLAAWYVQQAATGAVEPGEDAARAGVWVLLAGLPMERQGAAAGRLLDGVRELYRECGAPVPEWMEREG